jgi:segregation and condensation protein B
VAKKTVVPDPPLAELSPNEEVIAPPREDPGGESDVAAPAEGEAPTRESIASAAVQPTGGPSVEESSPADEPAPLQVSAELKAIVEALIFASPEPLSQKSVRKLLVSETAEAIQDAIAALQADYNENARGLQVVEVAGGFQIVTRPELHEWVRRLFHDRATQKLSVQALETLAVIAYKQPVTAAEITEIRGVNSAGVLSTLIDRKLIKIAGRKAVVGRPFMYATTREFLDRFGLKDLTELPKIEDLADVLGFEPLALQDAVAEVPLPFDATEPSAES